MNAIESPTIKNTHSAEVVSEKFIAIEQPVNASCH